MKSCLEICVSKHRTPMLCEFAHELGNLLTTLHPIPEHNLPFFGKAALCFVEEPCQILVVFFDSPHKLWMILLDSREDVIRNICQPARLCDGKCRQVGEGRAWTRRQDYSKGVHR